MLPEIKFFIYIFNFGVDTHEWKLYFYILIGGVIPELLCIYINYNSRESSLATLWSEELKVNNVVGGCAFIVISHPPIIKLLGCVVSLLYHTPL